MFIPLLHLNSDYACKMTLAMGYMVVWHNVTEHAWNKNQLKIYRLLCFAPDVCLQLYTDYVIFKVYNAMTCSIQVAIPPYLHAAQPLQWSDAATL